MMRGAPRPEPVGEPEEVRLVDSVQHLDHRPLEDLVLQRSDPERPQPPVRLRYVRPPRRPRPVSAPVDPSVQIPKVFLESSRSPPTSRRPPPARPSAQAPNRPPEGDRSTWCRSAVNRASLSVRAIRRTRSSSLSAPCPALGPGRVLPAVFPLAGPLPSTASAAPPWALFGSLTGSTRPSDFSRSSITGLRPWPSPHDPPYHHHKRVIVRSPGSQHEEITHMHRFLDPAGSTDGSRKRRQRCCLPRIDRVGTPDDHFGAQ